MAFEIPPETHNNLPESDRSCTLGRLLPLLVAIAGSSRWCWWWRCCDVVGKMMMMWRWWWWWWRRRVTGVWATRCWRVASGEIYSTRVVIVVVFDIMSSCLLFVLDFVGVFGPLLFRAMCVRPLSTEAAMRSGVEPWCGAWPARSLCWSDPVVYVGEGYSAPSAGRCSLCW